MATGDTNFSGLPSAKNAIQSQAATDLGLGDQLRQQLEDEVEARKRLGGIATVNTNAMSPAVMSLFGANQGAG